MAGVSNASVKAAVEKAAREHTQHLAGSVGATREWVTHEAEGLKAHANEKAGDILGKIETVFTNVRNHIKQAEHGYLAADAKLDAIAAKLAHSRWTALIFAAWTLLVFWLGTKL